MILLGIVVIVLAVVLVLLLSQKTRDDVVGICSFAVEQSIAKNRNKQKIIELLQGNGELTNEKIRERLGVSSASAVRYMDELEKEKKVAQVGSTGRNVVYKLNTSTG